MIMKTFVKIVDQINKVVAVIVVAFFIGAFFATFLQVVMRNLTKISVPWTDELSRYLVIGIVYLASGLAARHGKLIRMEVVPMLLKMSDRQIFKLYVIASFLTIAFTVFILISSVPCIKMNIHKSSASLGFSMAIPYLFIPIGSVWLLINMFANIIDSQVQICV